MHPGILLLPLTTLVLGLLVRRMAGGPAGADEARAVWVYGLVATAFLWPSLAIPDGVPSPAAGLYAVAPWQGLGESADPAAGNAAIGDVTFQIQPWLLLLRDQVRRGEPPLWNPHSFLGQPFWANGQSAPLFPLHLLFVALPELWGFLLLPWLRILIGALGTRRLALALGVGPAAALASGLAYALSGMVTGYLLFPMGNALVLVPWVLWATERLVTGRSATGSSGVRTLAVCVALLALAGHPGTLVHCALLSVIYLAVRGCTLRVAGRWTVGWAAGGALSLVYLLPVALYLPETVRWAPAEAAPMAVGESAEEQAGSQVGSFDLWVRVLPLVFRIIQPWAFGRAEHGTWHGPFYEPGSRVFVGLATLLLVLVAVQALVSRARREGWQGVLAERRPWALVVLLGVSGLVAYQTPYLLDAVISLPVVGKAQHYRLIFGVELCLALLAGFGVDRLARPGSVGRTLRGLALLLAAFGVLFVYLVRSTESGAAEVTSEHWPWVAWLVVAAGVLVGLARSAPRRLGWVPALLVAAELVVAHAAAAPGLSLRHLYPPTGATAFLADRPGAVAGVGATLRPNSAMVYGLRDLRGDDPARPRRFDHMYRHLGSVATPFFHPVDRWDGDRLDALGVRWVIAPPASRRGSRPREPSWLLAYDGADARVFERPGARPEAFAVPGGAALELERLSNDHLRLRGPLNQPGRWVLAEAWAPGWRARVRNTEGGTVEIDSVAYEEFLLAVDLRDLSTGGGALADIAFADGVVEVDLVYRPPGLAASAWVSLGALLWLSWPWLGRLRRRGMQWPDAADGRIRPA